MGLRSKQLSGDESGKLKVSPPSSEAVNCPRCDSTNTKFCYYNNYNKSQPRHFCKACQRHWTKGGILRNVPIGGGVRKPSRPKKSGGRRRRISTNNMAFKDGNEISSPGPARIFPFDFNPIDLDHNSSSSHDIATTSSSSRPGLVLDLPDDWNWDQIDASSWDYTPEFINNAEP